jgi:hypothetical protein
MTWYDAQTMTWFEGRASSRRRSGRRAQELWRAQLQEQEAEEVEVEVEENDEEWLTNQEAARVARGRGRAVTRRAIAWLRTDEPRRPLGRWAKGKVWSEIAEMYV